VRPRFAPRQAGGRTVRPRFAPRQAGGRTVRPRGANQARPYCLRDEFPPGFSGIPP
jgi:hypothetical protein